MEQFTDIIKSILANQLVESVLVIIISLIFYRSLTRIFFNKKHKTTRLSIGPRASTYLNLIHSILRYVFITVTILIILQINHIDVSSLLAGIGIAGTIFGLAVQDTLKDIIRGASIISDNYFSVGDTVKYNGIEGKVIIIGLKTTKIQDIDNENIISIANRKIDEIQVVAPCINLEIPLPYDLPHTEAMAIMDEIATVAAKSELIPECENQGANHLDDSAITYKLRVGCQPEQKNAARRAAHQAVLDTLAKHGISVPYNQLDIHTTNVI